MVTVAMGMLPTPSTFSTTGNVPVGAAVFTLAMYCGPSASQRKAAVALPIVTDPVAVVIEFVPSVSRNFTGIVLPSLKIELPSWLIGWRTPDHE